MADAGSTRTELAWREYSAYLDLYKYYITFLLQLNTLHFAVAGGLVAYVLGRVNPEHSSIRFSLLLPLTIGIVQLLLLFVSWAPARRLASRTDQLACELQLGATPNFTPLSMLIILFGLAHLATSVGIAVILLWPQVLVS